eukprot:gb/GECH01010347.1/.p1 GENE.gb/GECH01010347.1/~~gb/GECH01010347.1/.p1  ORF type:complete len:384 (+),score=84.78 gb/GECH01010347.1/:1-1152(+)
MAQQDQGEPFPILCESCLGPNPYLRMMKEPRSQSCKMCDRPMTSFKWRPGSQARFRKTEVCQTCAKLKNVCQCCLLDLEFGVPVQVRDACLNGTDAMQLPESEANREYFLDQQQRQIGDGNDLSRLPYYRSGHGEAVLRMARSEPYNHRQNRPQVCSFWLKGTCTRGNACQYLHEQPTAGKQDELQSKLQSRLKGWDQGGVLKPPDDRSITTLYIGGFERSLIGEQDIQDVFSPFGAIKSIRLVPRHACAFVTFTRRDAAERAARDLTTHFEINGVRLKLLWGKPVRKKRNTKKEEASGHAANQPKEEPPAPGQGPMVYPSMIPSMGAPTAPHMKRPPPSGIGDKKHDRNNNNNNYNNDNNNSNNNQIDNNNNNSSNQEQTKK